jgi:hypothetical protein
MWALAKAGCRWARGVSVFTLICVGLLASGCGSGRGAQVTTTGPSRAEARKAAEAKWKSGLQAWSRSMLQPVLAVSGQLGSADSFNRLAQGDRATRRKLTPELNKLGTCTATVKAIGAPPVRFDRTRATALSGCAHLEAGAALVETGLDAVTGGLGSGLLTRAAAQLNRGTRLLRTATAQASGVAGTGGVTTAPATTSGTGVRSGGDAIEKRLEAAGYLVSQGQVGTGNPPATKALRVALPGGGDVTIYTYTSASDAVAAAKPFASVEHQFPKQFQLARVGDHLYVGTVQQPAVLPVAAFNKLVKAAEGQ